MFSRIVRSFAARRARPDLRAADSIADMALRTDVWTVVELADRLVADRLAGGEGGDPCRTRRLVRAAVVQMPSHLPDGSVSAWSERWTVDRCGTESDYTVRFTPTADGGTHYEIEEIVLPAVPGSR
jgi:hypothetical protein